MGYEIAICETETEKAPCREKKLQVVRIRMPGGKYEEYQGHDEVVSVEDAKKAFPDFDAFLSRNRISPESTAIFMEKVKKEEDAAALRKYVKKVATGWVEMSCVPESEREKVLAAGDPDNEVTAWQDMAFDETSAVCAGCPLAWNKGKNCLETFGPSNSRLPEIAAKAGCRIVASVPESAVSGKKFTSEDAKELLAEVGKLRPALAADGKMAVHRYGGVVDKLESMAKVCAENGCGFYFF